ncbi:MAG TPA: TRAP transporter substrate-binding protein DctP [Elusimicrobiota bacterium]|jgi:TRAP-type C4-dicarboxylate transport system substrate-binding protein|nr:TRAP transporter substrate-binding protein DctP [Elusimicrobiota bacterium]
MKTRAIAAAVAASLFLTLSSSAAPAHAPKYKIRWLVGHQNLDYFEDAALAFKKTVETKSHGDIEITIVKTNDKVPDYVASGEAEMGHSFTDVMGAVDPRLYAFEAPYLMRGDRHMEGVIEGPIGKELLGGLSAHHVVGLALTYSGGASGIATLNRQIRRPEDLKGLKVGVYGDSVNDAWLRSLGATPVKIGHDDDQINGLARQGKLDAVMITWRNFERSSLDKDFKYVSMMGSTYLVSVTYVNDKFFASLPPEYRALLRQASHDTGRIERAKTIALNALCKRKVIGYGVRPVYLSERARSRFVAAVRPAYENSIEKIVGKALLDRMRKAPDGPEFPPMNEGEVALLGR